MSVANSCLSVTQPATVVGPRDVQEFIVVSQSGDDVSRRELCLQFERRLDLTRYIRDKGNEERATNYDAFVRINSKLLQCSYQIPAEDTLHLLKNLYLVLGPGLKVDALKKSVDVKTLNETDKGSLRTLHDWMACSDFTVQVFPRAPTTLWIDIDCLTCKTDGRGSKRKARHFSSKSIIETAAGVILNRTHCDYLYVTRGKTCGMHLFFPQVTLNTETEIHDLWAAVNRSLADTYGSTAAVDTGCSAMPMPLARDHNGLTRVEFKQDGSSNVSTQSFRTATPSVKLLARITNFYHLVAQLVEDIQATPPASVDGSILGDCSLHNGPVKGEFYVERSTARPPDGVTSEPRDRAFTEQIRSAGSECETVAALACETAELEHRSTVTTFECMNRVTENNASSSADGGTTVLEIQDLTIDDEDERDSSASSSSRRRLVQTDIRNMCAAQKRSIDTISDHCAVEERSGPCKRRKAPHPIRCDTSSDHWTDGLDETRKSFGRRSATEPTLSTVGSVAADSASSFLCQGFAPRVKTSQREVPLTKRVCEGGETRSTAVALESPVPSTSTAGGENTVRPITDQPIDKPVQALYIKDDSTPSDAVVPRLNIRARPRNRKDYLRHVKQAKTAFEDNVQLQLDSHENQTHETDIQLIVSNFNTEMAFYEFVFGGSVVLADAQFEGLRVKDGCSLHANRENCPPAMFPEHVPYVLHTDDFVTEPEWVSVLLRYFDDYCNNAVFLHIMSRVLEQDKNVSDTLNGPDLLKFRQAVHNCLSRFKYEAINVQKKNDATNSVRVTTSPKHPYEEKCTVVTGLLAVCSTAYKMVTPIFTDLAKTCRLMLGENQQTLDSLNSSTMSTAGDSNDGCTYDSMATEDNSILDESVSQVGFVEADENAGSKWQRLGPVKTVVSANIGNNHSIIASLLRWNYPALDEQTLWCLFFYYYHVHADGLSRIVEEMVHGGLMITAVLQGYFECCTNNAPIDVRTVCVQAYHLDRWLEQGGDSKDGTNEDRSLMPPPRKKRGARKANNESGRSGRSKPSGDVQKQQSTMRNRDVHETDGPDRRDDGDSDGGEADGEGAKRCVPSYVYKSGFYEVLLLLVNRYLRPVTFDEATVLYTEGGYEQCQNEYAFSFTGNKDAKSMAMDVFHRSTVKYSMPHGDLLMYNTDVMGTVHRRSACTQNLVLNVFENTYGGCMSYLTRRFNNNLKLFNRFNGDAYRLSVECRHAMNEFVRSIELSYINLILRQPIVPPVLESDLSTRQLFMSDEEIMKGAFVCLNTMDYVRSVNMFTSHCKFSQENCKVVESFLDRLITGRNVDGRSSEKDLDGHSSFRTVYLFYLLYVFEVLYKIRHAYNRDGSYRASFERLSWEIDVRLLLKVFFGPREFKTPRGFSAEVLEQLDLSADLYGEGTASTAFDNDDDAENETGTASSRCINTRPVVSTVLPDKMARMIEFFGKKGVHLMKSFTPVFGDADRDRPSSTETRCQESTLHCPTGDPVATDRQDGSNCSVRDEGRTSYDKLDRAFLDMNQTQLEQELYSTTKWYENCRVRVKAVRNENQDESKTDRQQNGVDTCMDSASVDTFLRTQLRVNNDNRRLNHIERSVRQNEDFAFGTHLPLRTKMIALVLATHSCKRLTTDVAADFVRKEYRLERSGVVVFGRLDRDDGAHEPSTAERPDRDWERTWNRLLNKRKSLLAYCRSLADTDFPDSYFVGLQPEHAYHALYHYMLKRNKYVTLHALQKESWAKDVCTAFNYLLVMNGYDPELVELCLKLFLGFEWPGQWGKRIFVWKSNSNAGKSFFFEHIIRIAFDQSTCINDPKGGKDNAPEKSEYYKNFVLMINEFTSASAAELKKLCSTSSYKFRMNFGNQMIQAFMVGKMVFNCNTLPLTTDHATIQRVALVPLPFWFQKRQTVVDSMLNWTRGQLAPNDYERNFRRNVSQILTTNERCFFIENQHTRNEDDLFNRPNETSLQLLNELSDKNARAPTFLVQNKTSQVYMLSAPPTGTIISGIVTITRYFCRFRFFNNIKEPVDYSTLPTACNAAAQEWQRISQPYFDWKERYRVQRDNYVRTKVSTIHASLNNFAKTAAKNVSYFDLRQFFEWDFAENKIPYYNAKEDEYNVRLDSHQE